MHPDAAAEIKIQVCFKQLLFGKTSILFGHNGHNLQE